MSEKDKTKFVLKAEVETVLVLPKTLQVQTELMPFSDATVPMYPVYGKTDGGRRVWCATFLDSDEAQTWLHASKVFGRAVKGAVVLQREKIDGARENGGAAAQEPS